jgi:signal transduction histidine kinase
MFQRLSIRWRITLGSALIAALFFGGAAFAFYNQVANLLSTTAETLLQHDAAPMKADIESGATAMSAPGHAQLVAIVNPHGQLVESTLPDELLRRVVPAAPVPDEPRHVMADDDSYLVLTQRVAGASGEWVVISARNLEASALLLDRLIETLIVSAIALTLGFAIASWLLTRAALRPVNRMRQQANELSKSGSTASLNVPRARDELSALASTLNEFITAQQRAVARERQMVSDASHELRSPLAILQSQLELAHLSSGDAIALERSIADAERSLHRISAVATGLLDLAEVESGPSSATSTWAELVEEMGSAADRARLSGSRSGIVVEFEVGRPIGAEPVRFALATTRFGRLVDNLAANAVHAMASGGELRMSLEFRGSRLVLEVRDSGPGLPDEFIPVAFDRFTRPDDSRSANTGGSGLGLAIVKAIVLDAHGDVELMNRPGRGLIVRVSIPAIS